MTVDSILAEALKHRGEYPVHDRIEPERYRLAADIRRALNDAGYTVARADVDGLVARLQSIANIAHLAWLDPATVPEAFQRIEALAGDKAEAPRDVGCGCTTYTELGADSCSLCGHRSHGRGGCGDKAEAPGFVRCPLCGDPERTEDVVGGVCLTCADAIAFSQNARRGAVIVSAGDKAEAPE